jgi:hypothetical protein
MNNDESHNNHSHEDYNTLPYWRRFWLVFFAIVLWVVLLRMVYGYYGDIEAMLIAATPSVIAYLARSIFTFHATFEDKSIKVSNFFVPYRKYIPYENLASVIVKESKGTTTQSIRLIFIFHNGKKICYCGQHIEKFETHAIRKLLVKKGVSFLYKRVL